MKRARRCACIRESSCRPYVVRTEHICGIERRRSHRCACTRVNSRCTRLLVYGIRMRVFARLHAHVCFRSCSVLLYIPPINRLATPCNLRVRMRISVFIACCFLACFQSMLGCGPANYARVHAHLPLVSCSVLYICCVYVAYRWTSTFACACAFTRELHSISLYVPSYIGVWCAYMRMHTRMGVVICM